MGKETKIGLAVIGALFLVFGVLLFRHLGGGEQAGPWENDDRAAAQPLTAGEASDKPNVVMAQREAESRETSESLWGATPAPQEARGDVPPASYMPAPAEPPPADVSDPYHNQSDDEAEGFERHETAESAGPPLSASPFQEDAQPRDDSLLPVPRTNDDVREPSPEDSRESAAPAEPLRNPLRQLSADLPLTAPDEAAGGEAPDASTADPYADDEDTLPSGATADNREPQSRMELPAHDPSATAGTLENAPADRREPGTPESSPDEAQNGLQDPFAEPAREPAQVRSSVPADHPPAAMQDDWSTAGQPDESIAGGQAAPPVEDGMYTVQPNDTLWSISEKVYGTGGYFKAIAEHNRAALPRSDALSVGMKVAVPPAGELEQNYPDLCPRQRKSALVAPRAVPVAATAPRAAGGEVYVVQEGDTLFDIARYELGKASRWAEIYELNRDKLGEDFDYLRPGVELRLPSKSRAAETISRGSDTRYLR